VPLGFAVAVVAFGFTTPSWGGWMLGLGVAAVGEAIRVWAAGHIEKGREITRSGPYRFVRHPLYLGSTLLGVGFAMASQSAVVAGLVVVYLALTLTAAIRTEEATLDDRFGGAYSDYRAGTLSRIDRRFSLSRAIGNREHRAVAGLIAAFLLLALRIPS
jgi:protein-S-isoprenylcysteine O-methyltransferase Ste14